jgi:hypothetical protein
MDSVSHNLNFTSFNEVIEDIKDVFMALVGLVSYKSNEKYK